VAESIEVTDHQMLVFLATGGKYNPQYEERTIKVCFIEFGEILPSKGIKDGIAELNF
jgi:hypothetical protein